MTSIVIVAPSIGKTGGAERTAAMLVNTLASSRKFKVVLCVTESKNKEFELEKSVTKIVLPAGKGIYKNIHRIKALFDICKKNGTDLLVGYTIIGGILACSVKRLLNNRIKVIVCERQDPNAFSVTYRRIRDFLYRFTDGAVFQTTEAQAYFSNICNDSKVIPNFIDSDSLPELVPYEKRDHAILSVGRLENVKNHDLVIKAFYEACADLQDWTLHILGEGSERGNLEGLINNLHLQERVFLPGYIENVTEVMSKSKILVLASKYEGYPNALLEGMACGTMCIAADCPCGGPRDMINTGENGLLLNTYEVSELAEKIKQCIIQSKESQKMAERALRIRETNKKENIIKCWIDYFEIIVAKQ